jgi:hypothetical protein
VNSKNALGYALIENFEDGDEDELWSEVFDRNSSDRIIEAAVNRLKEPTYETQWLHNHEKLLEFLADHIKQDALEALVPDFCETLKRLTYAPEADYAHTAARLVSHMPVVTAQVHKQLSDFYAENQSAWKEAGEDKRLEDFKTACSVKTMKGKAK